MATHAIEGILDHSFKYTEPFYLRDHEPGDMGWIIQQHGTLYDREFGCSWFCRRPEDWAWELILAPEEP